MSYRPETAGNISATRAHGVNRQESPRARRASPLSPSVRGPTVIRPPSQPGPKSAGAACREWQEAKTKYEQADNSRKTALAVAAAGLLPMNVYMSAYVSNEPLHAAWVSLALLLASGLLLAPAVSRRAMSLRISGVTMR